MFMMFEIKIVDYHHQNGYHAIERWLRSEACHPTPI